MGPWYGPLICLGVYKVPFSGPILRDHVTTRRVQDFGFRVKGCWFFLRVFFGGGMTQPLCEAACHVQSQKLKPNMPDL